MKKKNHMKALDKTELKIIKLMRSKPYQKITVNIYDGKIASYTNEVTYKPEADAKTEKQGLICEK